MSLDPDKEIVSLFGKTMGEKGRLIEGVILADGTRLLAEQITPEQWQWMASKGLPVTELASKPMNRAERRAAKKGMH